MLYYVFEKQDQHKAPKQENHLIFFPSLQWPFQIRDEELFLVFCNNSKR